MYLPFIFLWKVCPLLRKLISFVNRETFLTFRNMKKKMSNVHDGPRTFKHTSSMLTLANNYHIFAKQYRYSSTVNIVRVLYTCQLVQTVRKLIVKWQVLYFTKKVISRKNRDFLKIPNFSKFPIFVKTPQNWWPLDKNSQEFRSPQDPKMQEYTGFMELSSQNSDFSREIFTKILNFHDILGWSVTKFPGILMKKTPENTEIYGF